MGKTKTENFIERAKIIHGDKYDYSFSEYIGSEKKLKIICSKHGEFLQSPHGHLKGAGCFKCGKDKIRKSKEEFIKEAEDIHSNKYDYSLIEYKNNTTNIVIICPKHGEFKQSPSVHLNGYGCQKCGDESDRKTQQEFLKEAKNIHGDRYDYSNAIYYNYNVPVKILCKIHGVFSQAPGVHLHGSGCPKCGIEKYSLGKYKSQEIFLKEARNCHGDKYDYSLTEYCGTRNTVKIICPKHGIFHQRASTHIKGYGCNDCAIENVSNQNRSTTIEFIKKAKELFGDEFCYQKVNYFNSNTKVEIICNQHGSFFQLPYSHLNGAGCPKCARKRVALVNQKNPTGWSYTNWEKAAQKSKVFESFKVYIIECWNKTERFYKVGKTYLNIYKRFTKGKSLPYDWKIIKIIEGDCREICNLERKIQAQNFKYKYFPQIKFCGMYECFSKLIENE